MTPELKTACELIFQEHKISAQPIKWSTETFRDRISLGLSELARETLIKKNIIVLPDKSKKVFTKLNPDALNASNFEEAEDMVKNKKLVLVTNVPDKQPVYIARKVSEQEVSSHQYSPQLLSIAGDEQAHSARIKWYMKPLFYYVIWPLCAAVAGALITYLINLAFTKLFWS